MMSHKLAAMTEVNNNFQKLEFIVKKILRRCLDSHHQELNEVQIEIFQLSEGLHTEMEKIFTDIQDLSDNIQEIKDILKKTSLQSLRSKNTFKSY